MDNSRNKVKKTTLPLLPLTPNESSSIGGCASVSKGLLKKGFSKLIDEMQKAQYGIVAMAN